MIVQYYAFFMPVCVSVAVQIYELKLWSNSRIMSLLVDVNWICKAVLIFLKTDYYDWTSKSVVGMVWVNHRCARVVSKIGSVGEVVWVNPQLKQSWALYRIVIYWLYWYIGYTIHIVSFILVTRYFKRYIFA